MTSDDEKETKHRLQADEPGIAALPVSLRTDGEPMNNGINKKQDGHGSDLVEFEKDLPGEDQEAEVAVPAHVFPTRSGGENKLSSPDAHEHQESQVNKGTMYSERENRAKDSIKYPRFDSAEKISKGKSKRGSDGKRFDDNPTQAKRGKGNLTQPHIPLVRTNLFLESPHSLSPDRPIEGLYKEPSTFASNRTVRDGTDSGLQKGYDQALSGKSISESQQSNRRSIDLGAWTNVPAAAERPGKHTESSVKYSERSLQMPEVFAAQKDKVNKHTHQDGYIHERRPAKISKDGTVGDRRSMPVDSLYRKNGESVGNFKEAGSVSIPQTGHSLKDNFRNDMSRSPVPNARRSILQRELSDLELGELRESLPDETPGIKKQLERKLESKSASSDYWNADLNKAKPAGKITADSLKSSPPHSVMGVRSNPDGFSKKRTPEPFVEDSTKTHHRDMQPQPQHLSKLDLAEVDGLSRKKTPEPSVEDFTRTHHRAGQSQPQHLSRVEHTEVGSQSNKSTDVRSRLNDAGASQGIDLEGFEDNHRKGPASAPPQLDNKRSAMNHSTKESRKRNTNSLADLNDRQKDTLTASNEVGLKWRDISSDENNCSYSKYEKEEPELKGPIKDISEYKGYAEEYREKYDSYLSLNKILETYRNEFHKLGKDLELANGRDMDRYYDVLGQLKESYRQCGMHLKVRIKDYAVSYAKE
ncbi:hypothetical protein RJ639_014475 [Escallonia herrerae]|uniref:OCEL domain-containing protein n=1 Tax=Escallonia herrerae TaxID=1293975 RepID=A0AA88VKR5_9ASTE|nr:hypothetical protein RJ639_014475 [Escallonia herrerae]